ncbi:bifunctional precorrin-2 dehydrogenase/sirohydrochlorin ferrochelatase [Candidatus Bathycorpusculum sp.]|uniref:precorrin-2 dehydrogenase/sirohydrochlorin ferrochelatase family protein n=1 Tax=Candidatus Bathycorpusculum sp. TaxID=2994959 RepID=UPI00281BBDDB|nr:bifunctional precorrin-2 dehydrogenase/sirohydrochlorin ferrochelatase [Candidatus Termitimicrobium sp.]MCL2431565.1 bifunctional precorrin-2 dehydrogenase/sirohydrochlorin ferrochelatase [Candidatus Termitimicrobium sp.]
MLIDLKLNGQTVMVIGGGKEATRKITSFLDSGATIWMISRDFSPQALSLGQTKQINLLKTEIKDAKTFIDSLNPKPDVLLAATDNSQLNHNLIEAALIYGCMVYTVDNSALSDFILPAIAKIGNNIKIAISTGGKSPAMAHVLRERIEKLITPQDLLAIELQEKIRLTLKNRITDPKHRSKLLYEILDNVNIKRALLEDNLDLAQELALNLLEKGETTK